MRKYEAMNPSKFNVGGRPAEHGAPPFNSKMVLALESMILQNMYSLEEALEYYDAALECDSQSKITATMGKVKELLESMTSKARKQIIEAAKTGGPGATRGFNSSGDIKDRVPKGSTMVHPIPSASPREGTLEKQASVFTVAGSSSSSSNSSSNSSSSSSSSNSDGNDEEKLTVEFVGADDGLNVEVEKVQDEEPKQAPSLDEDKKGGEGFGEVKVNVDHDDLDSMLSAIDDKRLQLEKRAVEKERASPRSQPQSHAAAALLKDLKDLTQRKSTAQSSSSSTYSTSPLEIADSSGGTRANAFHLDKPMDTLDLQALSSAMPTMPTVSDISPASAFRLDSNFAMVRYDDNEELPLNIGSPQDQHVSSTSGMLAPSTSSKKTRNNSFGKESPIPALFMTGSNGEALEFDPASDNMPLWISGPDLQQQKDPVIAPHDGTSSGSSSNFVSHPVKTTFDHTLSEIRKTPRRRAPSPPKKLGNFASPTIGSKQKVRSKVTKFASVVPGEGYEAM